MLQAEVLSKTTNREKGVYILHTTQGDNYLKATLQCCYSKVLFAYL